MSETLDKPAAKAPLTIVGTRPIRPDGADKVTGRAAFGADFHMPGQLVGRVLRSPHAHARIVSIDTSKAKALPGVKAIVTAADFPDLASEMVEGSEASSDIRDLSLNVMARHKVLYHGHAVAAVAAVSGDIAEEALARIKVTYEVLPHVTDVEEAMAPGAPLLHDHLFTEGLEARPAQASNIARKHRFVRGDLAEGFAAADVVVERRYDTKATHQGYIEPHACVAAWGEDGRCDVWCSSQGQFTIRSYCAKVLGLETSDIRVTPAEIGGGFGGKTTVYLEPLALALSRASGHPVKMVMSREEVFRATGPTSGGVIEVKLGAKKDGTIVAAEVELKFQAGAFPGSPVGTAAMTALACYDIPNFSIVGWDVVTNTPKTAAYRAPGAPISAFGVESAVDELAQKLGLDAIAIREKNAVRDGTKASYGPTFQNIAYVDTLKVIKDSAHWNTPLGPNQGRGFAVGFWFNVGGESTAAVHIGEDGSAVVVTGNPDIGGSRASMAMMAAETLGLPIEKVRPMIADTNAIGYSMLTGGSRVTFATGMAVVQAAEKVVADLRGRAAKLWDVAADQVVWQGGQAVCLDPAKADKKPLTIEALAAQSARTGGPISAQAAINAQGPGPGFAAHLCDVEVDPETGVVSVLRYTASQDVGKAIHPSYVEGQVQGGVAQGVGWALNEEYVFDADGRMENAGFLDYRMPVASDLPMLDAILVETAPNPRHPFGAKGVGEVPIVPPLAAVANAVSAAIGVRMPNLPLSPPKVLAALDAKAG
ncbi:xanthine dehydrogenase family protein molybdopterin-binding subunit [uncultured Phenylobacterium sp.]|uniref:xanthine dehydrogenase family protein molybdopterin-binding subunit n=1 Tax=uncultured Phenylobacterium sp. TaxID=349273 RepID=UPI0025CF1D64|nr:xanthine dehydrogenase family protein molybdopterin-binding subunit [uncultured Phenylobacterium sp.]